MELIVISQDGIVIRTRMDSIRMTGRSAQGVSVINVAPGDSVASLATIEMGGNGGGAPKGPDGKQPPLDGLDDQEEEAPPTPGTRGRRPTPIRGRMTQQPRGSRKPPQKPAPMRSRPAAPATAKTRTGAGADARPAAKSRAVTKSPGGRPPLKKQAEDRGPKRPAKKNPPRR
jgi:hypothetical protein